MARAHLDCDRSWRAACIATVALGLLVPAGAARSQVEATPAAESAIDRAPLDLRGWSPHLEFGLGVLTQAHDGEVTIPIPAGSSTLSDSGDAITSGYTGFGLHLLSPALVASDWRPRLVLRSSVQIPLSRGLIADRVDQLFQATTPGFADNCEAIVPGTSIPTSTCSTEIRTRTTIDLLWTAGLGLDFTLPVAERIFHLQPAVEYIGMRVQPEGTFKRTTSGSITNPPTTGRFPEFVQQVGSVEAYHGVASTLTGSVDAHREGPWVFSMFLGGRAAWFLTDREIQTRRLTPDGEIRFESAPAVNGASEIQWQVMGGFAVRFDPALD